MPVSFVWSSRHLLRLVAAASVVVAVVAQAGTISINIDPAGTTSNLNLYGAVVSGSTVTWPGKNSGAYRDYQFTLSTASGSAAFDGLTVQLSALQKNKLDSSNTLRATIWAGAIPSIPSGATTVPDFSQSLGTITTSNDTWSNISFRSAVLSGNPFAPQTITTTPSTFFFRVWAEGNNNNFGFGTKMAATLGEYQAVTMAEDVAIDATIGIDANDDGVVDGTDSIAEVVPEPASIVLVASAAAAAGLWRRIRRGR